MTGCNGDSKLGVSEGETLVELSIVKAVAPLGVAYEILFVDDGSTDDTFDVARSRAPTSRRDMTSTS
jgi:hypothetical protein